TSKKTESISIGTKKTEFIEIKDFPNNLKAKNIILAIGDGVGPNQITLSRIAIGGLDHRLFIDQIPYVGTSLTHSYNNAYTDSAAASTTWSTGYKTKNRYLSLDPDKKILDTIVEMLHKKGYTSGIVATSSVTHATPAALYAHIDSRYEYKNIANQLINSSIDIALGGGKEFFDLNKINGTHYVLTEKESLQLNFDHSKKLIGLFDDDGIERSNEKPTQREMTNFALNHLNKQCNGFFLMTEGSQIDWAAHDNDANEMIEEFKDFDLTIGDLINFVNEDNETLLIVTSDHETGGLQILKQDDDKVLVQWGTGRHTSTPVGVHAYGPGAELFQGLMDNTDIHYKILEAIDYKNLDNQSCNI
ncbi:alkaline phosphatase, partial [Gammaproteobacteria bacterium]|nr:alkaline phosphatase [Gammaproteobacteria bacterium]